MEKINYTNYLRDKPQETDPAKLFVMKAALVQVLKKTIPTLEWWSSP